MVLLNLNEIIDKRIWRCLGYTPLHDIKIGLRIGAIYQNIKVSLNTLF